MKLFLNRIYKGQNYTIGKLYIDGKYFCDTLEDTDRGLKQTDPLTTITSKKVYSKTAIPIGEYNITLNIVSPRFKDRQWAKFCNGKLPRLINVPGFEGVLIHVGNTPEDTLGCILVGYNKLKGQLVNSTTTFKQLYDIISKAQDISITIK